MLRQRRQSGYTLLELLTAIAITGILLVVGVPSYRYMVNSNRATSQANAFLSLITFARTEAIRRNRSVALCKTTDGASCSTASTGWETGVLVFTFTDTDLDGSWDAGEAVNIIRADFPFARGVTILGNNASINNSFSYQPNGRGPAVGGTFTIAPSGTSIVAQQRQVVITFGRARIQCPNATDLQC